MGLERGERTRFFALLHEHWPVALVCKSAVNPYDDGFSKTLISFPLEQNEPNS